MNQTEDKWLAVITAGRWQIPAIIEAKRQGLKVVAIDGSSKAEGLKLADIQIVIDIHNHNAVLKKLEKLEITLSGAISYCSESGMLLAAMVREKYKLPGPRMILTQRLIDKYLQRKSWKKHGVPSPNWWLCRSTDEAMNVVKHQSLPLIIKPVDSAGSRGVTKIETLDEELDVIIDNAFKYSKSYRVLVESYMEGIEFTVETFGHNGENHILTVTEKKKVDGSLGVVASELFTPNRSAKELNKIKKAVLSALKAINYFEGPGHSEIILMKNGDVGLVEVAGRGGGFNLFEKFLPAVSGVNVTELSIKQITGDSIKKISLKPRYGVLRFFPSKTGTVKSIEGINQANEFSNTKAGSFVSVGDKVGMACSDGDRLGFIMTTAKNAFLARKLADLAEEKIKFVIGE